MKMTVTPTARVAMQLMAVLTFVATVASPQAAAPQERLRVVSTLTTYASIASEIAGERADVTAIARGDQDPHFVNARPSYVAVVQRADLLVTTGLDLELWLPGLLDRANNAKVLESAPGNVVAYSGITLLEIPATASRAGGDIHVFGNPHIHTDPVNGILIARNIAAGLRRVDPDHAATYDANLARFERRILNRLFGEEFVALLGAETLVDLAKEYRLWDFIEGRTHQGQPLVERLGGWMAAAAPFRGRDMVCYHKNWAYFEARFRVRCAMFVEPKPGIPPSPGHVRDVIDYMQRERIPVLFSPNYYSRTQVERVASRTGATAVLVPLHEQGEDGVDDYFSLVHVWVTRLAEAFRASTRADTR